MSYKVKTDVFEGPFDLLLYLVSRKKVDIGAISINDIADQYLAEVAKMQKMNLEVASGFLLVAATLLEIKANSLVKRPTEDLDEELEELTPEEAYEMLVGKLITYKQFKNAAEELNGRFREEAKLHVRPFGPDAMFLGLMPDFLEGVSLDDLGSIAAAALARREVFLLESDHIAAKPIPVEFHVESIHRRIREKKHMSFKQLLPGNATPALIVVNFLALLELYKRRMVLLEQPKAFGDIEIDYIEGSGELNLDEEPIEG